ncbi:LPS assembly lipoprotein LptE [Limimaricola pyoseonensis]|uniref:LPS-assembly lipoprotein n=1 Tax=Limimaricola pyoseonensis TaxID=521013 RepID=A0A1G7F133_9RHOB|nr:LPS assembly lipoprotein LptE [Limimaricola pyoseonensis]SDE69609.1 LPS-assembly lipoprotein [Limimaricola pyoseonensis]
MWWSEAPRRAVLLGALALGACGFAPAYGPGGAAGELRGAVTVEAPATFPGYALRERLLDRLGAPGTARYLLAVDPTETVEQAAISADGAVTRYRLLGRAPWRLEDAASGAEIASGVAEGFTGYSATLGTVASEAAEQDARDRLAVLLADRIVTRLIAAAPAR